MRTTHVLAWVSVASLGASMARAAAVTWDAGASDENWTSDANWSDNSNGVRTGDDVAFNTTGAGVTTYMTEVSPFAINSLAINTNTATSFSHTIDLNARTLSTISVSLGTGGSGNNSTYQGHLSVQNGTLGISGSLKIGEKTGNATGSQSHGSLVGGADSTVNASGLTTFIVGNQGHQSGSSSGSLSLGAGELGIAAGATFRVGYSSANAATTGTVTLGSAFTRTTIGTGPLAAERTAVQIGYKTTDNGSPTGSFTQNGGSFTAYASTMDVGFSGNGSVGNFATGTLDVDGASSVAINVDTLRIGVGSPRTTGTVKLAPGNVAVNTAAAVGTGLSGLLELNNTEFSVGSGATFSIGTQGEVNAVVSSLNKGITIGNASSTALIIGKANATAADRGLYFVFDNPAGTTEGDSTNFTGILYGLKWAGTQTSAINALLTANKIGWDSSATGGWGDPSVIVDGGYTYLGYYVVPEPSAVAMLGLAAVPMLRRRRN